MSKENEKSTLETVKENALAFGQSVNKNKWTIIGTFVVGMFVGRSKIGDGAVSVASKVGNKLTGKSDSSEVIQED